MSGNTPKTCYPLWKEKSWPGGQTPGVDQAINLPAVSWTTTQWTTSFPIARNSQYFCTNPARRLNQFTKPRLPIRFAIGFSITETE